MKMKRKVQSTIDDLDNNELSIGNPISEDRSRGEYFLERVEGIMTGEVKLSENVLLDEVC